MEWAEAEATVVAAWVEVEAMEGVGTEVAAKAVAVLAAVADSMAAALVALAVLEALAAKVGLRVVEVAEVVVA